MKEESDMAAHRDIRGCVSVVILAFNEAGNLTHLYERLCSVLEADGWELSLFETLVIKLHCWRQGCTDTCQVIIQTG